MTAIYKDKTVGVIGGMGPYATLAFYKCILDNTPAIKDWDHIRILIDSNSKIPSRTRAFLYGEEDPVPMMIASAESLTAAGADFIVVPCNSAHYFLSRVREKVSIPFIDMVDKTCESVLSIGSKKVGLLAGEVTVKGRLYEQRLEQHGVSVLHVTDEEQVLVREIIEDGKQNNVTERTRGIVQGLLEKLEKRGAETVILGCTELPLVMGGVSTRCSIVDSLEVLAKAVIREAKHAVGKSSGEAVLEK